MIILKLIFSKAFFFFLQPSQVSKVSNTEVLNQLSNLKKHLQRELSEVENRVHNSVRLF